jgi:hypothetical protein
VNQRHLWVAPRPLVNGPRRCRLGRLRRRAPALPGDRLHSTHPLDVRSECRRRAPHRGAHRGPRQ